MRFAIHLFEPVSKLNVKMNKSTISPTNVDSHRTNCVAAKWGLTFQFLPINYLGVPLEGKPLSKNFWADISEKIYRKINNRKYSYLSKGGKITLINSTLASFPTYQLSIFKVPTNVCKTIEKTWRNFIWKNSVDKNNIHLMRWSVITGSKENGGLGINRVAVTSFALFCK